MQALKGVHSRYALAPQRPVPRRLKPVLATSSTAGDSKVTAADVASTSGSSAAATPSSSAHNGRNLAEGLAKASSARDRLQLLQQLQQRSSSAVKESQAGGGAARMVDVRMYTTAVEAQRKTSEKLSDANAYISVLEDRLKDIATDLDAAATLFKKVNMEFSTIGRLAEATAAAVQFGVDKEDAIIKIGKLRERLTALETAMKKERETFAKRVPVQVPITWVGAASEVRLVGDFDQWTRGIELCVPDVESDSVLRTFEAKVPLLPGKYRVKFMVDGEWRLAPEWPTENNEVGETNNVLEVK